MSFFTDDVVETVEETPPPLPKVSPPSFFEKYKVSIILGFVIVIVIVSLSLSVYFVNKKNMATLVKQKEEIESFRTQVSELTDQIKEKNKINKKYCEENQKLRAKITMAKRKPEEVVTKKKNTRDGEISLDNIDERQESVETVVTIDKDDDKFIDDLVDKNDEE